MEDESNQILAYTDGSCYRKEVPTPSGGWAFHALYRGKTITRYGFSLNTTNNEMELMAIVRVLEFVRYTSEPIILYTDSQYAKSVLTTWCHRWAEQSGIWRTAQGFEVKNQKLIQHAMRLMFLHAAHRQIEIKWMKGHCTNIDNPHVLRNNLADMWAGKARQERLTNWKERK